MTSNSATSACAEFGGQTEHALRPFGDMQAAVRDMDASGRLLGVVPLTERLIPEMAAMAAPLRASRTPNILARAAAHLASRGGGAAAAEPLCTIERHGHKAAIPWSWLTVALAIQGSG